MRTEGLKVVRYEEISPQSSSKTNSKILKSIILKATTRGQHRGSYVLSFGWL